MSFIYRNVTFCDDEETTNLESLKSKLEYKLKVLSETKYWFQDQLGFPKENTNNCQIESNSLKLNKLFNRNNWKFDSFEFKDIKATFPLSLKSRSNVLNFASMSYYKWDVYCLMCDGM